MSDPDCVKCKGTGLEDSGGEHPWGDAILIPCDCSSPEPMTVSKATPMEELAIAGVKAMQELAHQTAVDAGWYRDGDTRNFGEVVALMHSELSEALEADRKGLKDDKLPHRDGREVEFADCIIRILDTAAALGLDVAGALIEKNRFNRVRADHKLENRDAPGGKRY